MAVKYKRQAVGNGILLSTIIGVVFSLIAWGVFAILLASMVDNGFLREHYLKFITPIVQMLVIMIGTFTSGKLSKEKKALALLLTAICYCFILLCCNIFLFSGEFNNMALNIIGFVLGCGLSLILQDGNILFRRRRIKIHTR